MELSLRGSSTRAGGGPEARDGGSEAQEFLVCSMSLHVASDLGRPFTLLILCSSVKGVGDVLWVGSGASDTQRFSLCPLVSHRDLDSDRTSWKPVTKDSIREAEGRLRDETGSAEIQ